LFRGNCTQGNAAYHMSAGGGRPLEKGGGRPLIKGGSIWGECQDKTLPWLKVLGNFRIGGREGEVPRRARGASKKEGPREKKRTA